MGSIFYMERNGQKYAYESTSVRVLGRKNPKTIKAYLGKVDPETGKIAWQFFSIYVFGFVFLWALKAIATYINHYCTRWVGARVIMSPHNGETARRH